MNTITPRTRVEDEPMKRTQINPWSWQDSIGFSHAIRLDQPDALIVVAGQTGVDDDGNVIHPDDFEAETRLMFKNMATTLQGSGATLDDVVKLTVFLLDLEAHNDPFNAIKREYFAQPPAQSTIGVTALAAPGLQLEVEALAVV